MNKKVIFINRFFYPDIAATSQLLTDLALYLQKNGYEITILSSRISSNSKHPKYDTYETFKDIKIYRLWSTKLAKYHLLGKLIDYLCFYINLLPALMKHVSSGDIVIIKTDPPLISTVATPIALRKKAKVICWKQDIFPEVASSIGLISKNNLLAKLLTKIRNHYLKRTNKIIVLSQLMQNYFISNNVNKSQLQIIHNWADGEIVRPLKHKNNPLHKKLGIKNKITVGYSGNLGRAHEYQDILHTISSFNDDNSVIFLIIGGGVNNQKLKEAADERQLNNIHFMGYLPLSELSQGLGCIDIHLTSLQPELERFIVPSKLYGILAAGRPTIHIGDNEGTIASILSEYQCGLSVSSNDPTALKEAIHSLKKDTMLRTTMGNNARKAYEAEYNKNNSLKAWLSCIEKITNDTLPPQ